MKTFRLAVAAAAIAAFALSSQARETISINKGWSFSKSISTGASVDQFARFGGRGEKVDLPHTWNSSDFMSPDGYYRGYGSYSRKLANPLGKLFVEVPYKLFLSNQPSSITQ